MMTITFTNSSRHWKRTLEVEGDQVFMRRGIIGSPDGKPLAAFEQNGWVVLEQSGDPRQGRRYIDVEITMGEEG